MHFAFNNDTPNAELISKLFQKITDWNLFFLDQQSNYRKLESM